MRNLELQSMIKDLKNLQDDIQAMANNLDRISDKLLKFLTKLYKLKES